MHIRVSRALTPTGVRPSANFERYAFVDVDRHGPLLWLALAGAILAVALIRLRGLLAAAGVGLSVLLVTKFLVPAILVGHSALLVSLVGALAVTFVTVLFTHGLGAQSLAATLGVAGTLLLTAVLATVYVHTAHLDGRSSEVSVFLSQQAHGLSLRGVVIAGMVVGALGVLADTAVTQASAVMALRRARPEQSPWQLYRAAFVVGRDHLSATIHTLVLAYVGAALPLLLVMRSSGVPFGDAVNTQDVAEPIVATAIGCIGLIAAVPIATGLASQLIARLPVEALGGSSGHGH
jgi:uncharacterized membrane protein